MNTSTSVAKGGGGTCPLGFGSGLKQSEALAQNVRYCGCLGLSAVM